jgi:hypothetical protein
MQLAPPESQTQAVFSFDAVQARVTPANVSAKPNEPDVMFRRISPRK